MMEDGKILRHDHQSSIRHLEPILTYIDFLRNF